MEVMFGNTYWWWYSNRIDGVGVLGGCDVLIGCRGGDRGRMKVMFGNTCWWWYSNRIDGVGVLGGCVVVYGYSRKGQG